MKIVKKAGCILVNVKTKEIALVCREKHNEYSFPKGHLEEGETIIECAIRETEEETGRKNKIVSFKPLEIVKYVTPRGENVKCYMYLSVDEGTSDKLILEKDKEKIVWKNFDEIEKVLSYENLRTFWNKIKSTVQGLIEKS